MGNIPSSAEALARDLLLQMAGQVSTETLLKTYSLRNAAWEGERRERFAQLGWPVGSGWPATSVYHRESEIHRGWHPRQEDARIAALTRGRHTRGQPDLCAIALPLPAEQPTADLMTTLRSRRSRRDLTAEALSPAVLATLLDLACGETEGGPLPGRSYPSAGGLYCVGIVLGAIRCETLPPALYRYDPKTRRLNECGAFSAADLPRINPVLFAETIPSLLIFLTVDLSVIGEKYEERGYRFGLLEAGHIAQNVCLVATALGLGAVPVGGFVDESTNDLLKLNTNDEVTVYAVAVGKIPGEIETKTDIKRRNE